MTNSHSEIVFDSPSPSAIINSVTPPLSDRLNIRSPSRSDSDLFAETESTSSGSISALLDVDPQILEALKSKDRIYVLKLGEQMEALIADRRPRVDLMPTTSYQRLLVHRCSAYYKLTPETDPVTKTISVVYSPESRIPTRRICELVPAELPAQPTFKIMRRSANDRSRSKPHSQAGSVAGEDAELSDVEPSESGSLGGRSNATGSSKKHMTIAEREAAYNEARSRIFMDFAEKEKEKEKDLSASSSSLSLTSGSVTSAGETSSVGDMDDSVSSPTTESEWSGPIVRDKKEARRSNGSSSRSLRSNAPTFNANGSGSSRGSRAPSPSPFKYPTLYEPSPAGSPNETTQSAAQAPGYVNSYLYTYPQPVPPPHNYLTTYPYYTPYPYPQHSQQNQLPHGSDPAGPAGPPDMYPSTHHPPQGVYIPYPWNGSQLPAPHLPIQQSQTHHPHQAPSPPIAPPASQYSTYMPPVPPYGPYPMPQYYASPPPVQHVPPSPAPVPNQALYSHDAGYPNGGMGHPDMASANNSYPGNIGGHQPPNGAVKRSAPPARSAWSYGPGIGMGGFGMGNAGGRPSGAGEVVGPRLSSAVRRSSGNSNMSPGNRTSTGDEASSTASSSTASSSSRRTFTSTSSQHPLPARPDWAVGLKPQPTLHSTHSRHHDHSLNNSRNISPARNNGQRPQQVPPVALQYTDFPPLTTISPTTEKRLPTVAGVWTNSSSTRSILLPGSGNPTSSHATALVQHPNPHQNIGNGNQNTISRPEDIDKGFERPSPKLNAELYNPKGAWKAGGASIRSSVPSDKEKDKCEKERVLVENMALLSVEDRNATTNTTKIAPTFAQPLAI
ncbi:hypothetical protein BJ138DRAFT_1001385 [Hygrophoropsis aurantiaca]|uniref:Uncharacterized protein n=1 Tax=Hygrophoropsis aurantiaca TaxID=72124 RepID=A0ACB8AKD8_9AGAM|nr:hypothetical protein BJ138DRAFT_1001385 [Hygrophoropsis aurantiaca]